MNIQGLIRAAHGLVGNIIYILMAAALLVFMWGLMRFMTKAGDEKSVQEGKNLMVWGLITLFVMVSVWGIIKLIGGELGITQLQTVPL